jgi:hypothetical protein
MIRADMACLAPFLQLPCILQKDNMVYPPQKSVHILKRFLTKKNPFSSLIMTLVLWSQRQTGGG